MDQIWFFEHLKVDQRFILHVITYLQKFLCGLVMPRKWINFDSTCIYITWYWRPIIGLIQMDQSSSPWYYQLITHSQKMLHNYPMVNRPDYEIRILNSSGKEF